MPPYVDIMLSVQCPRMWTSVYNAPICGHQLAVQWDIIWLYNAPVCGHQLAVQWFRMWTSVGCTMPPYVDIICLYNAPVCGHQLTVQWFHNHIWTPFVCTMFHIWALFICTICVIVYHLLIMTLDGEKLQYIFGPNFYNELYFYYHQCSISSDFIATLKIWLYLLII